MQIPSARFKIVKSRSTLIYKGLQSFTELKKVIHWVTRGYMRIQEATRGYRGVTEGDKGFLGVSRG